MLHMGIQPEKWRAQKNDMGVSVFPETDPISLFWGWFIYLLVHIGMNTDSRGVSSPDLYQNQVLYIKKKILGVLHNLMAMRPAYILQPFLSDNQKIFSKGVFS